VNHHEKREIEGVCGGKIMLEAWSIYRIQVLLLAILRPNPND